MADPNQQQNANGRDPIFPETIAKGSTINLNANTQFKNEFPNGPGFYQLMLRINIALTVGTAAGPVTDGELDFIRQLSFTDSLGEKMVDAVPARALYNAAIIRNGEVPRKDAIAASSATYRVDIPIPFTDRLVVRPEDTILNSDRFASCTLDVLTGPLTDLFTTPGTATVVLTADLMLVRSKGRWPAAAGLVGYPAWKMAPVVDASNVTYIDFDRAPDLWYKRLYIYTVTSGAAGRGFYGTASDAIIDNFDVLDGDNNYVKQGIWGQVQDDNKNHYMLETARSGLVVVDFCRDRSNLSALYSGDKNKLRLSWANNGAPGANSMVSVLTECYRSLRSVQAA